MTPALHKIWCDEDEHYRYEHFADFNEWLDREEGQADYTDTAKGQLKKLDKQTARRIIDFMDARIAGQENLRDAGKALTGTLGVSGVIGWAIAGWFAIFRMVFCACSWCRLATGARFTDRCMQS